MRNANRNAGISLVRTTAFACAALFAVVSARADTYFWNAKSGDWSTPGNWTVGEERTPATSAPGTEDDVFILAESGTITVTYKEAITVNSMENIVWRPGGFVISIR